MPREERQIVYTITAEGADESTQKLQDVRAAAEGLREQVAGLKEEPLKGAPEGGEPKEWKEARKRFSSMAAHGLKESLMKGDVKGAFANVGKDLGMHAANTLATKAADQLANALSGALSMIPGIGGLFSFLKFQHEGLVTRPYVGGGAFWVGGVRYMR